jgi:hypothetical protein
MEARTFDSGDLRALENLSGQANAKSLISMSFENWTFAGPALAQV